MAVRNVVQIDEEKCNGCGVCVPSCAEGAIQIIDGKARLVSDVYCDGLGACLGECPQDAIRIVQREAAEFDEAAAMRHVATMRGEPAATAHAQAAGRAQTPNAHGVKPVHAAASSQGGHGSQGSQGGCPGAAVRSIGLPVVNAAPRSAASGDAAPSGLRNWPLQLHLVPPSAPYLREAEILLVADCVPFALADFHRRFLGRRPVLIGCPKLDDTQAYLQKLIDVLHVAKPQRITVVHMEVPCCMGLMKLAELAIQSAGAATPLEEVVVSIRGEVLDSRLAGAAR